MFTNYQNIKDIKLSRLNTCVHTDNDGYLDCDKRRYLSYDTEFCEKHFRESLGLPYGDDPDFDSLVLKWRKILDA